MTDEQGQAILRTLAAFTFPLSPEACLSAGLSLLRELLFSFSCVVLLQLTKKMGGVPVCFAELQNSYSFLDVNTAMNV